MFLNGLRPYIISLSLVALAGTGAYVYLLKVERDSLEVDLSSAKNDIAAKDKELDDLKEEFATLRNDYKKANDRLIESNGQIIAAKSEYNRKIKVFEEENGRFKMLFQRRAAMLVALANNATERVWLELETKTRNEDDKNSSGVPPDTAPGTVESKFD